MSDSTVYNTLGRSSLARELENTFLQATGLPVELVPSGEPRLLLRFRGSGNPFCSLMAQFTGSCIACQKAHLELQQLVLNNLSPQVTDCFAGLIEFAVPVMVGEQHVATFLGGQIFQRHPTRAHFQRLRQQLWLWGLQSELRRIETAFFQTRVLSRKQFQASLHLLAFLRDFWQKMQTVNNLHHKFMSNPVSQKQRALSLPMPESRCGFAMSHSICT